MFSAMLHDAFHEEKPGLDIRHRVDGGLFNLRRLKSVTKCHISRVCDLLFADDCALNTGNAEDMQRSMDLFSSACKNFGLTISTKKTEVLHQPVPGELSVDPGIRVDGVQLNCVQQFTYLGSTLSNKVHIDAEIDARIAKASAAFGRLRSPVWDRRGIHLKTKLVVCKAIVLTTLLYASESWTLYRRHEKKLERFHQTCLRKILRIFWQEKIPDTEVLERAMMPSILAVLRRTQLRWAGHVSRMSNSRLPKMLLFGELKHGARSRGGQKKRYKDTLKANMKEVSIDYNRWEALASDRSRWRSCIAHATTSYEANRINDAKRKRAARKERQAAGQQLPLDARSCPHCHRQFKARIGLISHLRTHRTPR
jgi:transcription termination factor 2